jgi:hypothetical protein
MCNNGFGGSVQYAVYSISSTVNAVATVFYRYIGSILGDGSAANLGGFHMEGVIGGGSSGNGCYITVDFTNRGVVGGWKYATLTGGNIGSDMNVFMVSNTSSTNYDLYIKYGGSAYNGFNLDIKSFWNTFTLVNIEGTVDPRVTPGYSTSWDILATANFVRKSSTGNVGIGTTSPGYTLDVNGSGRFNIGTSNIILGSGQALGQGGFYIYPQSSVPGTSWNIGAGLQGSSSNAITFVSGTNVGIGVTNPTAAFQINGTGPIFNGSASAGPVTKYYNYQGSIPANTTPAIAFNFNTFSFYVKIIAMLGDLNNSNNVNILEIEAVGGNFYGSTPTANISQMTKNQAGVPSIPWSSTVTYGAQSITITPNLGSTGGCIWNTRIELVSMAAGAAGYVASLSTITQGGTTVYTPGY